MCNIKEAASYMLPCHWSHLSRIDRDIFTCWIQTSYFVVLFHHKLIELV